MDTAEVLRTARENIPGHWMQGDYTDSKGNRCSLGHIAYAAGLDVRRDRGWFTQIYPATKVLAGVIEEQYPECNGNYVALWNDASERTEDEVVAVFDKAIAKAEEAI